MLSWSRSSRPSQRRWSSPVSCGVEATRRGPRTASRWRRSISSRSPLRGQLLGGELADRVEHPEAQAAVDLLGPDEALVGEERQAVDDVDAVELARRPADRLGAVELAAADEDRQPGEQAALARAEQVVAPGDRAAERLLALGQVARAGRQDAELVLEPLEDRLGREELHPGRRELDRERHPVEPGGDPRDGRRVLVRDPEVGPDARRRGR